MRVSNFNLSPHCLVFILCVGTLLTACSSSSEVKSGSTKSNSTKNDSLKKNTSDKKVSAKLTKPATQALKHIHPSNPCTAAVTHSHPYQTEDHEHSYDCENTNKFVTNAHIHTATKNVRKYRHVHPNGANKHSHGGK